MVLFIQIKQQKVLLSDRQLGTNCGLSSKDDINVIIKKFVVKDVDRSDLSCDQRSCCF